MTTLFYFWYHKHWSQVVGRKAACRSSMFGKTVLAVLLGIEQHEGLRLRSDC